MTVHGATATNTAMTAYCTHEPFSQWARHQPTKDHERMIQSYVLSGEPARLPVAEVIELLARQDAAGDADDVDESPVFEHGTVGHDMEVGWHEHHLFDVRILTAEREWSSLIDQAVTRKKLVICNRSGRSAPFLGIARGFLTMAAVAQWLANGGANVELDGIRVAKSEPEAITETVERIRKAAMVKALERHWPARVTG